MKSIETTPCKQNATVITAIELRWPFRVLAALLLIVVVVGADVDVDVEAVVGAVVGFDAVVVVAVGLDVDVDVAVEGAFPITVVADAYPVWPATLGLPLPLSTPFSLQDLGAGMQVH